MARVCDNFEMPNNLRYSHHHNGSDVKNEDLLIYVVCGVVAAFVLMPWMRSLSPQVDTLCSGVETAGTTAMAMLASTGGNADTAGVNLDMLTVTVSFLGNSEVFTDETKSKTKTEYTEAEKQEFKKLLKEWMTKNKNGILIIVAKWCSHCHNTVAKVANDPNLLKNTPLLFIDYEALPKELFNPQSTDKLCDLQFFPTILTFSDNMKTSPAESLDTAVSDVTGTNTDVSAGTNAMLVSNAVQDPDPGDEDPFNGLF